MTTPFPMVTHSYLLSSRVSTFHRRSPSKLQPTTMPHIAKSSTSCSFTSNGCNLLASPSIPSPPPLRLDGDETPEPPVPPVPPDPPPEKGCEFRSPSPHQISVSSTRTTSDPPRFPSQLFVTTQLSTFTRSDIHGHRTSLSDQISLRRLKVNSELSPKMIDGPANPHLLASSKAQLPHLHHPQPSFIIFVQEPISTSAIQEMDLPPTRASTSFIVFQQLQLALPLTAVHHKHQTIQPPAVNSRYGNRTFLPLVSGHWPIRVHGRSQKPLAHTSAATIRARRKEANPNQGPQLLSRVSMYPLGFIFSVGLIRFQILKLTRSPSTQKYYEQFSTSDKPISLFRSKKINDKSSSLLPSAQPQPFFFVKNSSKSSAMRALRAHFVHPLTIVGELPLSKERRLLSTIVTILSLSTSLFCFRWIVNAP